MKCELVFVPQGWVNSFIQSSFKRTQRRDGGTPEVFSVSRPSEGKRWRSECSPSWQNLQPTSVSVCLQNGSTALHAAVMGGNVSSVQLLLGAGADPALPDKVSGHAALRWVELPGFLQAFPPVYHAEQQTTCRPYKEPSHPDALKPEECE